MLRKLKVEASAGSAPIYPRITRITRITPIGQLEGLIEAHETQWPQKLVVRSGERFDFVPVDSIDWIESGNNYSVLHCGSNDYLCSENLTALERRLNPGKFFRVHRCHMVHVNRIGAVHSIAGGVFELELQGGTRIRTGRQYSEGIRRLLKSGS